MSDIVITFLNEKGLYLKDDSFFAQQLGEIQSSERREWLKTYLSDSTYFLLHGIIDQVYSLDTIFRTPNRAVVSITGYILFRSILEYSYKLTYLAGPETSANERIKRAIELYYSDLCAYKRLPEEAKVKLRQDQENLTLDWYKEVTDGKDLKRPISVWGIFSAVGDPEDEEFPWPKDSNGTPVNPVYMWGYRVTSPMTHGNLWAIKHHRLTQIDKSGGVTKALPDLDPEAIRRLQTGVATVLQLSFGIAVQFMHGHLPSDVMNRLGAHIGSLTNS